MRNTYSLRAFNSNISKSKWSVSLKQKEGAPGRRVSDVCNISKVASGGLGLFLNFVDLHFHVHIFSVYLYIDFTSSKGPCEEVRLGK